jgi:hypothetical protein
MKRLITFGDKKYERSMLRLEETALQNGVDKVNLYSQDWLKHTEFWNKNSFILNQPRGAGYWIWKPYIILDAMDLYMEEGDIVMYSDAAVEIIDDLSPLFQLADEKDRVIFQIAGGHNNKIWTKRDCFVLLNCDEQKYWDDLQLTATFSLWKKTEENISFLKEYLRYLRDPRIVTDDPNMCGKPNFLEFRDHRHDQSVLSILTRREGFERFCDPSQWGNLERERFSNSPYGQLINHHRKKL